MDACYAASRTATTHRAPPSLPPGRCTTTSRARCAHTSGAMPAHLPLSNIAGALLALPQTALALPLQRLPWTLHTISACLPSLCLLQDSCNIPSLLALLLPSFLCVVHSCTSTDHLTSSGRRAARAVAARALSSLATRFRQHVPPPFPHFSSMTCTAYLTSRRGSVWLALYTACFLLNVSAARRYLITPVCRAYIMVICNIFLS